MRRYSDRNYCVADMINVTLFSLSIIKGSILQAINLLLHYTILTLSNLLKCNFSMNPRVRLLVDWLVGLPVGLPI